MKMDVSELSFEQVEGIVERLSRVGSEIRLRRMNGRLELLA